MRILLGDITQAGLTALQTRLERTTARVRLLERAFVLLDRCCLPENHLCDDCALAVQRARNPPDEGEGVRAAERWHKRESGTKVQACCEHRNRASLGSCGACYAKSIFAFDDLERRRLDLEQQLQAACGLAFDVGRSGVR